jgi:hypothetical protein
LVVDEQSRSHANIVDGYVIEDRKLNEPGQLEVLPGRLNLFGKSRVSSLALMPGSSIGRCEVKHAKDDEDIPVRPNPGTACMQLLSCAFVHHPSRPNAEAGHFGFTGPSSGLSGLGNSEQSISSIAKDIIGLLDELQIREKIVVVGHSMGGIIVSYIAAEHPDRVKGVVLIGPVNPVPAMADVFSKRIEVVKKGSYFPSHP